MHGRLGVGAPTELYSQSGWWPDLACRPLFAEPLFYSTKEGVNPSLEFMGHPGDLHDSAAPCRLGGSCYFLPAVPRVCLLSLFPLKRSSLSASKTPRPGLCCLLTTWFGIASCT